MKKTHNDISDEIAPYRTPESLLQSGTAIKYFVKGVQEMQDISDNGDGLDMQKAIFPFLAHMTGEQVMLAYTLLTREEALYEDTAPTWMTNALDALHTHITKCVVNSHGLYV